MIAKISAFAIAIPLLAVAEITPVSVAVATQLVPVAVITFSVADCVRTVETESMR